MIRTLVPLTVLLAACEPSAVDSTTAGLGAWAASAEFEAAMRVAPARGGCGDISVFAHDGTDTRAVFVNIPGLATDAASTGAPVVIHRPVASAVMTVTAQTGTDLTSATCVGALPFPGPTVNRAWYGASGVVHARVTPDPSATPSFPVGIADVRLSRVTFVDVVSGASFTVRELDIPGVPVGLYPP